MSFAGSVLCAMRPVARPILRPAVPARLLQPIQCIRPSSHSPLGSSSSPARKKVTLPTLMSLYRKNEPITVITAHDFPSAHVADQAGIDMVLVGDSLAMVALGMDDTSEVLMEEMLLHCRSVARGAKSAFLVCGPLSIPPRLLVCTLTYSQTRSAIFLWAPTKSHPTRPSNPQSP
jgi:3-methyl-2-oxobutanoate hydroxymethyltransferase